MQRYSVIDLGSNTIRLVAYDVLTDKKSIDKYRDSNKSKLFDDAVNEKKTAGLATYVDNGVFSDAGIDKAHDVLSELLAIAKHVDSDKTRIFATAVLRNCSNSEQAVKELEDRLGKKIDLLSAEEEAHLGYIGATCTEPAYAGTLIDIGGGSTELTVLTKDGDKCNLSLGMGSVSSYSKHVRMVFPDKGEIESIASDFEHLLETHVNIEPYESDVIYGIGGSVRAVAKLAAVAFYEGERPKEITRDLLKATFDLLEDDPSLFAHLAVRAVPDRLHSLVPGATIMRECMRAFHAQKVRVRKYGVREGYLLDRMLEV